MKDTDDVPYDDQLRDHFAVQAMRGILGRGNLGLGAGGGPDVKLSEIAKMSYQLADAMMTVRKEKK